MVPKGGEPAANMVDSQDSLRRRDVSGTYSPGSIIGASWYSATGEETPPRINESTFCMHNETRQVSPLYSPMNDKTCEKKTQYSLRASFHCLLSGNRKSDHFAFQKIFSIKYRNLNIF